MTPADYRRTMERESSRQNGRGGAPMASADVNVLEIDPGTVH
jgi:hypothetical protein